ncbi:MAG TPA: type IV pilus secretin PilQ [Thermodesulfobacteriota bacterium]
MSTRKIESGFLCLVIAALLFLAPCLASAEINSRIASDTSDERLFSIEVREADISDVLRALAQQSGLNIILGEGVAGKVSVSFRNIPFDKAMEMIIKANGLMYTVQNEILWVGKKVDVSDEMRVEIIRLNNADPAIAVQQLKGIVSETGTAFADQRTNSVILRDLPRNIDQAKGLLIALDTQASQVVIEARIVEASNTFARQIGVRWGPTYTGSRNSVSGSDLLPETPSGSRNFSVNLPATNPTSGIGLVVGSLSDKLILDLELSAAETRGDLKIVSSPRISTVNNKPATIHSGLTFRVKLSQAIVTGTGATTTSTTGDIGGLEEIKTGIDLTVTPKISDDGFVLLNINTQKSDPDFSRTIDGIPGVAEKSASTFVLVKDGETAVIGGLYRTLSSSQKSGVPFLSKIPILGAIFRSTGRDEQHEELLVFITPKIVKYENTRGVSH